MQTAGTKPLDFTSQRARFGAFTLIALLGAVLLVSPTLFYIAVLATCVVAAPIIPATLPHDPTLARLLEWMHQHASWVTLAVCVCWIASSPQLPPDDLLRHILSAGWGHNYLPHYEHHLLPTTWSWSIGFDVAIGRIHALTGGDILTTVRVVRSIEAAFVGSMLVLAIGKATKSPSLRFLVLAIALIGMIWPRIFLGRPEAVFIGIVFAAFVLRRGAWLALFAVLSTTYAFSPVYAAACLLLGNTSEPIAKRLAKNLVVGILAVTAAVSFWMGYTGGEYTLVYTLLQTVLKVQTDNRISIGELQPLTAIMASPIALAICFGVLAIFWKRASYLAANPAARNQVLLVLAIAAYFSLPNYVRYASIIWPLFLLAALLALADDVPATHPMSWLWIAGTLFIALNITPNIRPIDQAALKTLRVPAGSKILAPFNSSSYLASATNPDAVVTPIFDLSTVTQPAQGIVRKLSEGTLDCPAALSLGFDYLIENSLKGNVPSCVRVVAIEGDHRLWQFVR